MTKRIIFDIVLLGAIFYTPWWVVVPFALAGAFIFPSYYEIFGYGLLMDLLYGTPLSALRGTMGTVGAIAIFLIAEQAKKIVRPTY